MDDLDLTLPLSKATLPSSEAPRASNELTDSQLQAMFGAYTPASRASNSPHSWVPPSVEDLQRALPQYEVQALIARGGMGAVYKGTQKTLRRTVAIKVLPPGLVDDDMQFAARFKHEAQAMAQLSHPGIVAVFDAGETPEGLLYFVMEYIEGTDVAQLIASEGRIDPQRAVSIISAVCDALGFAHESGIIHRDIKPSNIMVDRKGRVKVADFGLAKAVNTESTLLTGSNVSMGTADFIAPEALIAGMQVDQRADLYAVGVMLYQMLTGNIPRGRFQLPSRMLPQIDHGFDTIVDKAMQADREKRYSTAHELRTDLERVGQGSTDNSIHAHPAVADAVRQPKPTRPLLLLGIAAVALLLVGWFEWKAKHGGASVPQSTAAAPQWKKIVFSSENITTQKTTINASGELTCLDGFDLLGIRARNIAIRGELRQTATPVDRGGLTVQLRVNDAGSRIFAPSPKRLYLQSHPRSSNAFIILSQLGYPVGTVEYGDWVPFQFAAVGTRSLGSIRHLVIPPGDSPELVEPGIVRFGSIGSVRNLEVLVLDDLPEAEALKLASVDAGNFSPSSGLPVPKSSLSPSAESWRDVLHDPKALNLSGGAERTPEGLRFTDFGSATVAQSSKEPKRDGAIRTLATFGSGGSLSQYQLVARSTHQRGAYQLVVIHERLISLNRFDNVTNEATGLRKFPLSEPLKPGQDYEMELRVVGQTLTAKFNGEVLGTVTDGMFPEGNFAGGFYEHNAAPFLVKALEVLDLDVPGGASPTPSPHPKPMPSGKPAGTNPASSARRATAMASPSI